jgi:hypothetical protein
MEKNGAGRIYTLETNYASSLEFFFFFVGFKFLTAVVIKALRSGKEPPVPTG